jgi:hypothetical protein
MISFAVHLARKPSNNSHLTNRGFKSTGCKERRLFKPTSDVELVDRPRGFVCFRSR